MIKRHINLKTTRLKQTRKQAYSKQSNLSLQKKVVRAKQNIRHTHAAEYNSYFIDNKSLVNQFKTETVEDWIAIRILDFLNRARQTEDLTEVNQSVDTGNPYSIGKTVAQRILDYRQQLAPFRRFTALSQLEYIEGFGTDKFNDLVRLLAHRADDSLIANMYNGVIFDNWKLKAHRIEFEEIQNITSSGSRLREIVADKVEQLILTRNNNNRVIARLGKQLIKNGYIESFSSQEYAAIALAFWLYKVDADNWFSLERALEKTRSYFAHYDKLEHRLELHLFKGFPNADLLADPITNQDLPIIINYAEKSISIWAVSLSD
ncbi:MAG: hypothetical protein AAFO82_13275 [Bacteroidota bacterium]